MGARMNLIPIVGWLGFATLIAWLLIGLHVLITNSDDRT